MPALLDMIRGRAERAAAGLPGLVMRAEKIAASITHGEHSKRRAGAGEKFWQFRAYDPSDRPQDIDWKQSAKTQHVFVREKEWQNPQKVMFWCAGAAGMDYSSDPATPTKHETALVMSLALAILMTRAGEQVAALGAKRSGRSELAIRALAEHIVEEGEAHDLPDPAALSMNAGLVMAGDFLSNLDYIRACFDVMDGRTRQGIIIQILDPAEIDLPFEGRALFRAPGLGEHDPVKIDHIGEIRRQYQERITEHCRALEELCRQYGWLYFFHRTDHDLAELTAAIWDSAAQHTGKGVA
ncbi:MAG: DUF58 domain-containing protein [Alphaproteobacteria bacterium]|nr:DUF58 domain-containing protein [Alphaproteobacteria bacterium]MCD8519821.1 DUF58 domain-containing protein [Alphaproteobacteria bacterium]MCD8570287.1 DUF58 domain-containing protein [Alphaproteobacteria bacterium]